jgi:DNA-binding LacI/PurR family transcriptional regulator
VLVDDDSPRWVAASMEDVAAASGVSVSTVSRALRGGTNVKTATVERVLEAAARLGFVASPTASSLATGKVKRIAVLIGAPLTEWFSGVILDRIYRVLRENGFDLLVYRVHDREERDAFFTSLPARRNADALIVASFTLTDAEQEVLGRMRTPLVYLSQHVTAHSSVGIDDAAGAAAATRLLLSLGHTRILYGRSAAQPGFSWSARDRYLGYTGELDAAAAASAPVAAPVSRGLVEFPAGPGFGTLVAGALLAGRLPAAIVMETDELAMQLLLALARQGVRVPEDVSVVGFDGHQQAEAFGLTTIAQPADELARRAAELAVALARGGGDETAHPVTIELPTTLVLRSTTRAPG